MTESEFTEIVSSTREIVLSAIEKISQRGFPMPSTT